MADSQAKILFLFCVNLFSNEKTDLSSSGICFKPGFQSVEY